MEKAMSIPDEVIINKIHFFREKKVMLDRDLAELYNVTTFNLNKAVKRNLKRFPADFMFQLTEEEYKILIFQNGISSWGGNASDTQGYFVEAGTVRKTGCAKQ